MSKFKKFGSNSSFRHDPLDQQILQNRYAGPSNRFKVRSRYTMHQKFVDNRSTCRILQEAQRQKEDLEDDYTVKLACESRDIKVHRQPVEINDEDFSDLEQIKEDDVEIPIDEETAKVIDNFMSKDHGQRETVASIIKEKLTEKKTEIETYGTDTATTFFHDNEHTNSKHLKQIARVLRKYRSGKLPSFFKLIPKFRNHWEQLLFLTEPDKWTAAAVYQATRIFSSNLDDKRAQRFYNVVLLPRFRDDIAECKKLNIHLYRALEKALFKPGAFFKGIVIPLCKSGDCSYREASIVGSILAKHSIPVLHSGAALLTIAEMDFFGVGSIFMRILLEKKYALPIRVVRGIVAHFVGFTNKRKTLPLLWHQCLLTFLQLYKCDLSGRDKEDFLKLITVHRHEHVTPEIYKELQLNQDPANQLCKKPTPSEIASKLQAPKKMATPSEIASKLQAPKKM